MNTQPPQPPLDFEYRTQSQRVLFGTGRAAELLARVLAEPGGLPGSASTSGSTNASGRTSTPGSDAPRVMVIASRRELERSTGVLGGIRPAAIFDDVVQHVPVESAERARQAARDARIDVLVPIGGGSAIGLAKAVARAEGLPIVAVPTTYSGSEATAVWGQVEHGVKTTGFDPRVLPGTVIYDAELSRALPRDLSVSSGLNALAHGIDALWAPGKNPVSSTIAAEAIRMLAHALPLIADDPGDLAAREEALYGAYLSASAFSSAGSGLHHKICHVLGGTFGLPHSETHAIVLPHVVAFNVPAAPEAEALLARALGAAAAAADLTEVPGPAGTPAEPPTAVESLVALSDRLHAPTALRDFGFREEDITRAVALIVPAAPPSNPRPVTPEALTRLLHDAWSGDAPVSPGALPR
ncbi:maleylacetate reductase [Cryobacterium shii]|uniref:maleylacetate reductase n=1 Tax=Cryobacterium shii TaxID=1259235 RepID=UPI001FCC3B7D|nr:maleylacetate reductase [Cryobacterium shii]